jgi:hypothetical protein
MFSDLYALAETFVSKTATPVNTVVRLACLVVPVNNKLVFFWNNLQFLFYSKIIQTTSKFIGLNM